VRWEDWSATFVMLTPVPGSRPSRQACLVAVTLADLAGRALGAGEQPATAS
jgi:hypothetical protein